MITNDELEAQAPKSPKVPRDVQERREQDIRVIALQAAVAGSGAGMNERTVVARAKAFEDYVLNGAEPKAGRNDAWVVDSQ